MTHNQKIEYMGIAADLCKFHFEKHHIDLLVCLYDLVTAKEGNANMMDVATIQSQVKARSFNDSKNKRKKK